MTAFFKLFLAISLFSGCKKSSSANELPAASIESNTKERDALNVSVLFKVTLNKASTVAVTLQYKTIAGTAIENTDYITASGTLSIPAGQSTAFITVIIKGDSLRKANQKFSIQLYNPQNCTIGFGEATGTIINENGFFFPVDNIGYSTPATYPGYTLSWSDEFNGSTINSENWVYEIGNNGWGNNELENYTSSSKNSFVSKGNLIIEARKEQLGTANYTSARMITKGKKIFKYGRIDIRAKLPKGKGVWPAIWMLGANIDAVSWPACGEIDIMELLGDNPAKIYGTMHWGADWTQHKYKGGNYTLSTGSFDQQFHVFSMDWKQDSIKLLIDDVQFYSFANTDIPGGSTNPFNNNFFFLLNVAVGGNWPGNPDGTTLFPQRMVVDYIRVFQ